MEIERLCLDEDTATQRGHLWWERWWIEREARLGARRRPDQQSGSSATNPLLERRRYQLTPDGKLISVETA